MPVRIFIYRMFNIRAIVALPRNVFIDTPTLTSLLFAQKKEAAEILAWDTEWAVHIQYANAQLKAAKAIVSKENIINYKNASAIAIDIMKCLTGIIDPKDWVYKKGKNAEVMPINVIGRALTVDETKDYYDTFLKSASINKFIDRYAFRKTSENYNQEYLACTVDEVGYKLSKRKERSKPNQLIFFKTKNNQPISNLHLCDEEYFIHVDSDNPRVVLDFIRRDVKWSE